MKKIKIRVKKSPNTNIMRKGTSIDAIEFIFCWSYQFAFNSN